MVMGSRCSTAKGTQVADGQGKWALLLSIRPRHAEAILAGTKTVEVRRRRVVAPPGTRLILYATTPIKAVVATATLASTTIARVDDGWAAFSDRIGLERHELEAYAEGVDAAFLLLVDVRRLPVPLTLEELRADLPFRPPQSYRWVNERDPTPLRSVAARMEAQHELATDRETHGRQGAALLVGRGLAAT